MKVQLVRFCKNWIVWVISNGIGIPFSPYDKVQLQKHIEKVERQEMEF